jgi:hypothetical protein
MGAEKKTLHLFLFQPTRAVSTSQPSFGRQPPITREICRVRYGGTVLGLKTLHTESGNSWENGYIEPFKGKLRDELLTVEIFITLFEVRFLGKLLHDTHEAIV